MTYIDGFVIPVPNAKKTAYRDMAVAAAPIFREHGALRIVECWGDEIPEGKVTDFRGSVKAAADENVVFSWIAWPSKAVRDAGMKKVLADPRMKMEGVEMPFDTQRMIVGGFEVLMDSGG